MQGMILKTLREQGKYHCSSYLRLYFLLLNRPSSSPCSRIDLLVKKQRKKKKEKKRWESDVRLNRALNKVTILDWYLILVIQDLLDELHEAHYFYTINVKSGYHQIRVRDDDAPKMAFRTHSKHYEHL